MSFDLFTSIFLLLCGVGVFLTGMKLMGDGLERSAGGKIRKLFGKLSNNSLAVYGIGAACTGVVQSSSATSVMCMGLVGAGMMTVIQGGAFILGARLGTTITGILVSLSSFSVTPILMATALVGVCLMLFVKKNEGLKTTGAILTGFGVLFTGMYLMSLSIKNNAEITAFFMKMFIELSHPALLLVIGIVFAAVIQSSSAVSGIVIVMINSGTLQVSQGICIIIGATVGTCITGILAGIGANTAAKRVSLFNVLSAIIGVFIIGTPSLIFRNEIVELIAKGISTQAWQLSIFGVVYSFIASIILLPFIKPLTVLCEKIIKPKKSEDGFACYCIDEHLLKTPTIAVMQAKNEVAHMAELAKANLDRSINALLNFDFSEKENIEKAEEEIDFLTKKTSNFLILLSTKTLSYHDENLIGSLHHVIDDVERIGDHAEDFLKQGLKMKSAEIEFSEEAKQEILALKEQVDNLYMSATEAFISRDESLLRLVAMREALVDEDKKRLADMHVKRLTAGKCKPEAGTFFYTAIASLERIGDHLENVAFSIKSVTGSTNDN